MASTILVADDDAHLRRVISLWMTRFGYGVIEAKNGAELVELYRKHQPLIVITDVNMPEMDGLEATRRILDETDRPVGIIVLSCRVDMIGVGQMFDNEFIIHHGKPFSPSRLISEVRSLEQRIQTANGAVAANVTDRGGGGA